MSWWGTARRLCVWKHSVNARAAPKGKRWSLDHTSQSEHLTPRKNEEEMILSPYSPVPATELYCVRHCTGHEGYIMINKMCSLFPQKIMALVIEGLGKKTVVLPRNTPHVFAYIMSLEPYNKPIWWVFLFLVYRRNWGSEISYLELCWRKNMCIWPSWNFRQLVYVFLPAFRMIVLLEASSALLLLSAEVCARTSFPLPKNAV